MPISYQCAFNAALLCASFSTLATSHVLVDRQLPSVDERSAFYGGWSLIADTCPGGTTICGARSCCPTNTVCDTSGSVWSNMCCPGTNDCSNVVKSVPVCADSSWVLWDTIKDPICCLAGEIAVQPQNDANQGSCVAAGANIPSSLLATKATPGVAPPTGTITSTASSSGTASNPTATSSSDSSSSSSTTSASSSTHTSTLSNIEHHTGLTGGAIGGIAAGGAALLVAAALIAWCCIRRNRRKRTDSQTFGVSGYGATPATYAPNNVPQYAYGGPYSGPPGQMGQARGVEGGGVSMVAEAGAGTEKTPFIAAERRAEMGGDEAVEPVPSPQGGDGRRLDGWDRERDGKGRLDGRFEMGP